MEVSKPKHLIHSGHTDRGKVSKLENRALREIPIPHQTY